MPHWPRPPVKSAPAAPSLSAPCPGCQTLLPPGTVLCIACGYDLVAKKRRVMTSSPAAGKKSKGAPPDAMVLLRGAGLSAVLGAIVWAIVAVLTGYQIGWIAWGGGAAAGGGMSYGADEVEDGTIPGIITAFMALAGILLGKILIVIWLLNQAGAPEPLGQPVIALVFRHMFAPIDAVFILLAFFTAYKLGSGASKD